SQAEAGGNQFESHALARPLTSTKATARSCQKGRDARRAIRNAICLEPRISRITQKTELGYSRLAMSRRPGHVQKRVPCPLLQVDENPNFLRDSRYEKISDRA